ncbi:MAG: putative baseplate assembly protein [Acidobacteriia bacterium]|nr:putative baseplate assembly protein [Terriglobia bacterium]
MAPNLIFDGKPPCDLVDCRPPAVSAPLDVIPQRPQSIDYLAKDYDSFLRGMLDMLPTRLPGWQTRTEADLGMALLELFAFVGDQLSYYQDRVANEGYLSTAVQYESVRRLLSLIDHHLAPGMAARALVKVTTTTTRAISQGFKVTTKGTDKQPALIFEAIEERVIYPQLNDVLLHANAAAGATQAVLEGEFDLFLTPGLWIWLQSATSGEWAQLVDPVTVNHITHITTVNFSAALTGSYDKASTHINGNGVVLSHGESHEQSGTGTGQPSQQIALDFAPLTYVADASGVPQTTLQVTVAGKKWQLVEDFIDSVPTDLHYTQSQDNQGYLTLQFGDGQQGRRPENGVPIEVRYRSGIGSAGMVAPGTLTEFDKIDPANDKIGNPQASFGGADGEDLAEAKLTGPRTLRQQNRAVTPQDYANALLKGVPSGETVVQPLHARAQFVWTGSWNSVIVSVDFADRRPLASVAGRRQALEAALEQKRLAGYGVQVEDARYAPLNISLVVFVKPEYFVRQVRTEVERAVGPLGFFAPAHFDFGQSVRLSDLYAAVLAVQGVRYITVQRFKRLGDRYPDHKEDGVIDVGALEIARCDNDQAHPENGMLFLHMCGGKEG